MIEGSATTKTRAAAFGPALHTFFAEEVACKAAGTHGLDAENIKYEYGCVYDMVSEFINY